MKKVVAQIMIASRSTQQKRVTIGDKHGGVLAHAARCKAWLSLCAALFCTVATAFSQSSPADGPWSGQIQCQLHVQQSGYTRDESQTWTLASKVPTGKNGDMRLYPATWTATGQGGIQKTLGSRAVMAQWNLSAPATPATIAMFIRAQDKQFVIRLWQRPIPATNTLRGTRQFAENGVVQPGTINSAAQEWTLPWILADARANISGKFSIPTESLGIDLTPTTSPLAPAVCVWQFAHDDEAPKESVAAVSGATASVSTQVSGAGAQPIGNSSGSGAAGGATAGGAEAVSTQTSAATAATTSTQPVLMPAGSGGTIGTIADPATASAPLKTLDPAAHPGALALASSVDLASALSIQSTNPRIPQITPRLVSGGTASLLLSVSNGGPAAADGTVVSIPAVAGVTIQGVTCSLKTCPTIRELAKGWTISHLAAGATETLTMDASVSANSGPLTLTAEATPPSGAPDLNPANNSATLNATVVPLAADLKVSVSETDHGPAPQTEFAYLVTVTNVSGLPAYDAVVISPAIAGIKKLAVSCTSKASAVGNPFGGAAICPTNLTPLQIEEGVSVPQLYPGSDVTFIIHAFATTAGNHTLSASATLPSGMSDPVMSNNSATAVVATIGETPGNADVAIVINRLPDPGKNTLGFNVIVRNAGPDPASLTTIRVPAVVGTTAILGGCSAGITGTGNRAQCPYGLTITGLETGLEIPWFPANSTLTFTIELRLPTSSGTATLWAHATVPKGAKDPEPKNNSAHLTSTYP